MSDNSQWRGNNPFMGHTWDQGSSSRQEPDALQPVYVRPPAHSGEHGQDEPGVSGIGLASPGTYPHGRSEASSSSTSTSVVSGNPEKPYKCDRPGCNSAFAERSNLNKHILRHDKPFPCRGKGCIQAFGAKKDEERHMWSNHPLTAEQLGLTPLITPCRKCGRMFQRPDFAHTHESRCDGTEGMNLS